MASCLRYAILSLTVLALFGAGAAQAVDKQNHYLILGPGSNSCAVVLADLAQGIKLKNDAADVIYSMWLAGNLSAYNRDTHNTYSIVGDMSFTDVFKWTLDFCKEHPTAIYSAAADAFVHEYFDDRYAVMPQQGAQHPKGKPAKSDDEDEDDK